MAKSLFTGGIPTREGSPPRSRPSARHGGKAAPHAPTTWYGTFRSFRSAPPRPARCQGSGPARPRSAQEEPGQARDGGAVRAVEAVL